MTEADCEPLATVEQVRGWLCVGCGVRHLEGDPFDGCGCGHVVGGGS